MWKWPWLPDSSFGRLDLYGKNKTNWKTEWLTYVSKSYVAPAFTLESDQFLISISSGACFAFDYEKTEQRSENESITVFSEQCFKPSAKQYFPFLGSLISISRVWSTDLIPLLNIAFSVCSLVCFSFHACVVRTNASFVPLKFTIFPLARSGMARQGAKKKEEDLNQTPKNPSSLPFHCHISLFR